MPIDKTKKYETHKPKELSNESGDEAVTRLLNADEQKVFFAAKKRADTAGPIMVGGRPATMPGSDLDRLYDMGLVEGANPCYIDEATGQVHIGHFVFVPLES